MFLYKAGIFSHTETVMWSNKAHRCVFAIQWWTRPHFSVWECGNSIRAEPDAAERMDLHNLFKEKHVCAIMQVWLKVSFQTWSSLSNLGLFTTLDLSYLCHHCHFSHSSLTHVLFVRVCVCACLQKKCHCWLDRIGACHILQPGLTLFMTQQ